MKRSSLGENQGIVFVLVVSFNTALTGSDLARMVLVADDDAFSVGHGLGSLGVHNLAILLDDIAAIIVGYLVAPLLGHTAALLVRNVFAVLIGNILAILVRNLLAILVGNILAILVWHLLGPGLPHRLAIVLWQLLAFVGVILPHLVTVGSDHPSRLANLFVLFLAVVLRVLLLNVPVLGGAFAVVFGLTLAVVLGLTLAIVLGHTRLLDNGATLFVLVRQADVPMLGLAHSVVVRFADSLFLFNMGDRVHDLVFIPATSRKTTTSTLLARPS